MERNKNKTVLQDVSMAQQDQREFEYPAEQYESFEDYEEFYGADAYLTERYSLTPIGNRIMEFPLFFKTEAKPGKKIQPAKKPKSLKTLVGHYLPQK